MAHVNKPTSHQRVLACNRTLNLRSIKAIGYDMDYTIVHYRVAAWEEIAFEHIKKALLEAGWPVDDAAFDSRSVIRGLVVDTELGNIVKANRFGFIKRAVHGTRVLDYDEMRRAYARTQVELSDPRWVFLNTLFSLSEGCFYRQLVDLLDAGKLPETLGYHDLYSRLRQATDTAHMEGELKAEILANPEKYVLLDEETPQTLLDQKMAGKKLLLITNSGWAYTEPLMHYAVDPFLPEGMTWRDLFDVVIVAARKPAFFTTKTPLYAVANEEGLLREAHALEPGHIHVGGSNTQLEAFLGLSGDEILYVGDHMFGDVHVTKDVLRWRTVLILRELENEIQAMDDFDDHQAHLQALMKTKENLEARRCQAQLALQRLQKDYGPPPHDGEGEGVLKERIGTLRAEIEALDDTIAPLAKAASEQGGTDWGLLLRAGNDKSLLARQVERYADVYTSRVSNLLGATPFAFLRSARGSLPHDRRPD
jgi:HAD superfamily 5'-nucleotidase-like hydrolase